MDKEINKQKTSLDLSQEYWDNRYKTNAIGWDMGEVSPPLKSYIDQLRDFNLRILIPGCGNTYEADYLLKKGFTNITVIDISPSLVAKLQEKYVNNTHIKVLLADFFEMDGKFDLILEQTFFCAINPELRKAYIDKVFLLLADTGKIVGLLFDKYFEAEGPPFGGSKEEYVSLFKNKFDLTICESCYNSHSKRENTEIFISFKKIVM